MSQGMRTTVKFRELLGTLTIGQPSPSPQPDVLSAALAGNP